MARPRTLTPEQVKHIYAQPKTREAREALGKQYGIHPRSIASIQLGYSYADVTGGGDPIHRKMPGDEILQRRYAGESTRSIAESLGTSTGSIRAKIGRHCRATGMPWPAPDKSGPKSTSPSDARPSSGAAAPSRSTRAHSGGDVASQGKKSSAGKAKGGRTSAETARSYYATFGGRRGDMHRARLAAQQSRANANEGTCSACQSAPAVTHGLCTSCDAIVTRCKPAAAYGGEPDNLSRTSSGLEADNIITAEPEAA